MENSGRNFSAVLAGVMRWTSALAGKHQPVNSYIVNGTLIDPAVDVPHGQTIERIVATHVQQEHVAGAPRYPEAPIFVPQGDEILCRGEAAYRALITDWESPWDWDGRGNFPGHLAGAANERVLPGPLNLAGTVAAGDTVGALRAIATPGHGKHALTYLAEIEGKKIAFCGDVICGDGKMWNWFDCDWDYGTQAGHKAVLASAQSLIAEKPDVLLPSHGEPIFDAAPALQKLIERLERVLQPSDYGPTINFEETSVPNPGWRQLSANLYQWKNAGNCAVIVSRDGVGLLVDDGLCDWLPLDERAAFHRKVMEDLKTGLGLSRIEIVIPTHYHGDHIYNIPMLRQDEPALKVWALDTVADVVVHPDRYNLCASLPWYGTPYDTVSVDRILNDGEEFNWHEYQIRIFQLGGQTYYHCGISTEIDGHRVTFVGDALGCYSTGCDPVLTYNDAEPTTRGWAYSVDRMIAENADLLVCGHAAAIRDPQEMLEAKRENWRRRLAEFDELNAQGDRRAFFDPFFGPDATP